MSQWGWSMEGCEDTIREATQIAIATEPESVRYLEIGVANGSTFARVCEVLATGGKPWEATALDLPDGIEQAEGYVRAAVCLNLVAFKANTRPFEKHVRLLRVVSRRWLSDPSNAETFSLVLVDGCHERICVREDFEALERHINPGGVVIFHDTAPWGQDEPCQVQAHRGELLQVRLALEDLGLLPCTRPGWELIREALGIQERQGRGCMAFRRLGGS